MQIGDYYITLATLPSLKTIQKSFEEGVYNTYKSWVDKLDINTDSNITVIGGFDVTENLTAIKPLFPTFREASQDNSYKMYTISQIKEYFVGGKIEVINLPTDEETFKNLYNNNSSHTYYNPEQLNNLYSKYKGTHAIKVSYGNGFSKIIPVFEKYHTLEQLLNIINKSTRTRNSLNDPKNTGLFLGNKLLNVIQIENVYKSFEEREDYKKYILTKIYTQIFSKYPDASEPIKLKRSLKNIFRSHEVIGDGEDDGVKDFRIKFANALIKDEENGNDDAIEALFLEYAAKTSQFLQTALKEAKLVNNFYKKLKELTKNKFYVSVVLGNKIEKKSQIDLVELGLSQEPEDNLVTGFIVETPKLLLNLEEVMNAHKNSMNSGTQATPKPTSNNTPNPTSNNTPKPTSNNTQGNNTPNVVQNEDEIDELISKFKDEQTEESVESLAESFLDKKD